MHIYSGGEKSDKSKGKFRDLELTELWENLGPNISFAGPYPYSQGHLLVVFIMLCL